MLIKVNEEIKEYCRILKLKGVLAHFEETMTEAVDYEDYLHSLLTFEIEEKDKRTIESRIRNACFPYKQYLEDIEMDCLPKDMQKKLPELATLDFIEKGKNIIMTGNPGTGKTMISIALGIKACMVGYKVLFTTIPLLFTTLKECNSAKTLRYFENRFEKYDLVIADELGYTSFDREGTDLLFSNLSLRAARKSTIITTNLSFERWVDVFTYKAILINMEGDSYRLRETLKENGIQSKTKKKYKATTNSNHDLPVAENILNRDFVAEAPNQKLVSDITYVATDEGWLYVAGVMDLCGGVITGLSMSGRMTKELVIAALEDAYRTGGKVSGAIIHSDRGSQYCSNAYQEKLKEYGYICSMSRKVTAGIMLQWSPFRVN